jgi:hypothetical protein
MMNSTIRPSLPMHKLLYAIATGRRHRATHETYDAVVKAGLARYESTVEGGRGWVLTDAGKACVGARS